MIINLSANNIITCLVELEEEYCDSVKRSKKEHPYGQYLHDATPLKDLREYIVREKAEKAINNINWIFIDLDTNKVVRVARKWYRKTNYQFCLSEETAERIINYYTK